MSTTSLFRLWDLGRYRDICAARRKAYNETSECHRVSSDGARLDASSPPCFLIGASRSSVATASSAQAFYFCYLKMTTGYATRDASLRQGTCVDVDTAAGCTGLLHGRRAAAWLFKAQRTVKAGDALYQATEERERKDMFPDRSFIAFGARYT